MKKIKTIFAITIFIVAATNVLMAQDEDYFSTGELSSIYTETISLLTDYNTQLKLIGDVDEIPEDREMYVAAFVEMFYSPTVSLQNDLDPTGKTSPVYIPEDYGNNILLFYPTFGIEMKLKFETMKFGTIKLYSVGQYAFDLQVEKEINGFYKDKTPNRKNDNLQFRIIFDRRGAVINKFKIAGIRKVDPTAEEVFIDKKWWTGITGQWKKSLRTAIDFKGEPEDKEIMAIRQLIMYGKDIEKATAKKPELKGNTQYYDGKPMLFSSRAFGLSHLVAEVEPYKKRKKNSSYTGIVLNENFRGGIQLQEKNGSIRLLSKEIYRVKQRKTPEQIKNLKEQVAKLELDSTKYTLILENDFIMPVTIIEKNIDNTKIKAKSPAIGNKELTYSIFEIKEIILPVKRQGLYINAHGAPGFSQISDENVDINSRYWTNQEGGFAMNFGVGAEYYITENFGFGIGGGFGTYTNTYFLNEGGFDGELTTITYTDGTTEDYQFRDSISASSYVERNLNVIQIPLYFSYITSAESYRAGLIVKGGIKYILTTMNNNSGAGIISRSGTLQNTDIEIGKLVNIHDKFIPDSNVDGYLQTTEPYGYKSGILLFFHAGWIIPLGKGRNFITLGPTIEYGFDINAGNYKDIFNEDVTKGAVSPLKITFDIGFDFKLGGE